MANNTHDIFPGKAIVAQFLPLAKEKNYPANTWQIDPTSDLDSCNADLSNVLIMKSYLSFYSLQCYFKNVSNFFHPQGLKLFFPGFVLLKFSYLLAFKYNCSTK